MRRIICDDENVTASVLLYRALYWIFSVFHGLIRLDCILWSAYGFDAPFPIWLCHWTSKTFTNNEPQKFGRATFWCIVIDLNRRDTVRMGTLSLQFHMTAVQ